MRIPPDLVTGAYRYPDGSAICRSRDGRKWVAYWSDATPLRGDNDERSYFETPEEAEAALAADGEGPASVI